jgi:hypothetical protein
VRLTLAALERRNAYAKNSFFFHHNDASPDGPSGALPVHGEASTPDPWIIPSQRRGLFLLQLNISRAPLPVRPVISTSEDRNP